jgi:hypothetical protein
MKTIFVLVLGEGDDDRIVLVDSLAYATRKLAEDAVIDDWKVLEMEVFEGEEQHEEV